MNIRETEVAACIPVRELFVIESEQVEDRRVEIVNVNGVLLRLETEIVRRAVGGADFRAAAREPGGGRAGVPSRDRTGRPPPSASGRRAQTTGSAPRARPRPSASPGARG